MVKIYGKAVEKIKFLREHSFLQYIFYRQVLKQLGVENSGFKNFLVFTPQDLPVCRISSFHLAGHNPNNDINQLVSAFEDLSYLTTERSF